MDKAFRVVVLVLGQDGMCFPAGPFDRTLLDGTCQVTGTPGSEAAVAVCRLLTECGLRPSTIDSVQEAGCSVMVILAETEGTMALPELRQHLLERGQPLGVRIRVQREDVFLAMHRI